MNDNMTIVNLNVTDPLMVSCPLLPRISGRDIQDIVSPPTTIIMHIVLKVIIIYIYIYIYIYVYIYIYIYIYILAYNKLHYFMYNITKLFSCLMSLCFHVL